MPPPPGEDTAATLATITFLNTHFASLGSVKEAKTVLVGVEEKQRKLVDDYSQQNSSPALVATAIEKARHTSKSLSSINKTFGSLHPKLVNLTDSVDDREMMEELRSLLKQRSALVLTQEYLKCLSSANSLWSKIQSEIETDPPSALSHLQELQALPPPGCEKLQQAFAGLAQELHVTLKSQHASAFQRALKAISWPKPIEHSTDTSQFESAFKQLVLVQKTLSPDAFYLRDRVWAMELLLRPLSQRFRFNFMSDKATNRLDRPEWFYSNLSETLKTHSQLFVDNIQPIFDELDMFGYDALTEFIAGLVALATSRINQDLPSLVTHAPLLVHAVDEAVQFDAALSDLHQYSGVGCVDAFTSSPAFFEPWIAALVKETKTAFRKIMASESAFSVQTSKSGGGKQDTLPSEAAEEVMCLIDALTDRYKHFSDTKHRLLCVQTLQIDTVHAFITEVDNRVIEANLRDNDGLALTAACLSSLLYCRSVLDDWKVLPFFVDLDRALFCEKESVDDNGDTAASTITESIFDEVIEALSQLIHSLEANIVESTVAIFKDMTKGYRALKKVWAQSTSASTVEPEVSPELCVGLTCLSLRLSLLENSTPAPFFPRLWKAIATAIDGYIYEQVIKGKSFTRNGALQLSFDMKKLFSLFGGYTKTPHNYLKRVKEAVLILTLKKQDLPLLLSSLNSHTHKHGVSVSQEALHNLSVFLLSPQEALCIARQRDSPDGR